MLCCLVRLARLCLVWLIIMCCCFFFFKQKTSYVLRISDWSSDVCSSDLTAVLAGDALHALAFDLLADEATHEDPFVRIELTAELARASGPHGMAGRQMMDLMAEERPFDLPTTTRLQQLKTGALISFCLERSEEHTSELQYLMRI